MPNQETFHLATSVFQTKHWRWPLCRWPWGAGWPYKVREGPKIRDLNLTVTRLRGRQKYCTTVSYYTLEPQDFVPYSVSSMHWSGSDFTTVHRRTRARLTCWPYKVDKHDTNLLSLPACSFALKLVTFGWPERAILLHSFKCEFYHNLPGVLWCSYQEGFQLFEFSNIWVLTIQVQPAFSDVKCQALLFRTLFHGIRASRDTGLSFLTNVSFSNNCSGN